MAIVTISRELGAEGTRIAEALAQALGALCVDKQVLAELARQAGLSVEMIVHPEERLRARPNLVSEEMKALFAKSQSRGAADLDRDVQQMITAFQLLAKRGNMVFVGRGGQIALRDHPHALHVHLYAPVEVRARRIQARRSLPTLDAARQLVQEADEQRRQWYRQLFQGTDWKKPYLYHLMIDTHRLTVDLIVALIVQVVQADVVAPQ
ncbi:MAG: cytidylate kinase-like family protein [Caldilinea sp. CFX5]|nr:cytidylate kinase-like family protein [Caldilinea sp. CFX5]